MFTPFPTAGQRLRGRVLWDLFAEVYTYAGVVAFDQNVGPSNTTLVDVDDALVNVDAGAAYEFDLVFQHSSSTVADIKFSFEYPLGLTMDYAAFVFGSSGTWVATRNDQTATFSPSGGSTTSSVWLHGLIQVGAAAGVLQLKAAQNTSEASTTNVEAGTMWRLTQIDA